MFEEVLQPIVEYPVIEEPRFKEVVEELIKLEQDPEVKEDLIAERLAHVEPGVKAIQQMNDLEFKTLL